ncbi:1958_t:CDS:1 [Diversispora eburnea]|uniref:1958_t:CDS:1 n=1 Tax=Diversispora eburnea TaxID=1213867 RepID=A0A9N8WN33_9GLOM|nr:1958_t:CDS:1 [Diversispora eburnea]
MAANKIPTEIVIKILNNVQSSRDLHSSLLVNRIWCKVTIPILWELPFGQDCSADNKQKLRKKALCIRTYISCMDTQARTLLAQNGFYLLSSPPQATFDYPSFTHKFIINNLVYFLSKYSSKKSLSRQILFLEIFKLIMNRCKFVDSFKITKVPMNKPLRYSDLIGSILKLPGVSKVFRKLESFTSTIRRDLGLIGLYESLTLICDNILNMDLYFDSFPQDQLTKLISVQKRLENLSIVVGFYSQFPNSLFFEAIISQKETLKSLRLESVNFFHFKGNSASIGQFISLQDLYIKNCSELYDSKYLFLASSFPHLISFRFIYSVYLYDEYPQEFIVKILETANENLKNICLDLFTGIAFDVFSAILIYCTKITELSLRNLSFDQVLAIFNNNFNELRIFSFGCGEEVDANELLCQMAENVPESLETIEIKIRIFSADSFRKFIEGWCCKGGGGSKKIIVRRTSFLFELSEEHFKVTEEYGVDFKLM